MIGSLPPGLIIILGALAVPFLPGRLRYVYMMALPALAAVQMFALEPGTYAQVEIFGYTLTLLRVDTLARAFGLIFCIASAINVIYGWHEREAMQHVSALIYAGAAVGAVFVGDLISLFVFWELTAIASVFLIWAARTERAYRAGLRYLVIQVGSGVILLVGVILHYRATGSLAFTALGVTSFATTLIFVAFGIKCAFPLLHNWLQDAYPEATVFGTVVLSAFTTKLAVYALARGFPGTDMLIWIGATMTAFPIFYAVIENDLRRVLAYSLNNQLGFMVVGIGIGTPLALNGTVAHAFSHILYKALLFMSMGAVLYRVGTVKGSELGGLYKSMPMTAGFCIVGAASISAFPLFSGFISKSMIVTAAATEGHWITWLVLLFASAGVFHHSGIKIPFFAFFAHDSGKRCEEAPTSMLIAMGITAALCIGIGVWPQVDYVPYTTTHVITQLQLLMFSGLAFSVLMRTGLYPPEIRSTNIDSDWIYRRLAPRIIARLVEAGSRIRARLVEAAERRFDAFVATVFRHHGPQGILARTLPPGITALWVAVLLGFTLILYYI
jgi:multicomponent Na+:H+ antiporter subunit D